MASGYWTPCDVCARVYWQAFGKTSFEAHDPRLFMGECGPTTADEGDRERASEEADLLNELESIAEAAL